MMLLPGCPAELSLPHTHVDTIFVDGAWQPSRGTGRNPVTDPATGEVWGSVPDGTPEDVDAAVGSAQRAFQGGVAPADPVRARRATCSGLPRKWRSAPRSCP